MSKRGFEKLTVWNKSHKLVLDIYKITKTFPREEKYGLVSQMRKAAYSVPSNIVEGNSRRTKKDYRHFLDIARASLEELRYFLLLSRDLEFIPDIKYEELEEKADEVAAILYSFQSKINSTNIS